MKNHLSISEMAAIHNLSRQTLIYYDKIGLFKPKYVDENGYRYYGVGQIPILREICFLKTTGIKLDSIKSHFENRSLDNVVEILTYHKKSIDEKIQHLTNISESIQKRLNMYERAEDFYGQPRPPVIEEHPERSVIFVPFENESSREELHMTMMKTWNILNENNMLPSYGFGTILLKDSVLSGDYLKGAGTYTILADRNAKIDNTMVLPAGPYVCMHKYGMPYDVEKLVELMEWIDDHGYQIAGNIIDSCILDSSFYENDQTVDFCKLEIPIKKKSE